MVPLLVGIGIGIVADELLSDDKKELQTSTDRKQISASDVPADIRAQIEGGGNFSTSSGEYFYSAQECYQAGNEYCYGWNGRPVNKSKAKELYLEASSRGHGGAATQLRNIWGIY